MQKATLEGWFIDILPDLNQDDPEVARYIIQNTLWWVGVSGLDGIRQDTLPYVHRRFWRDWMAAIKKEYPDLRVVGELFDGDPALVSFYQGGVPRFDGIDSGVDTLFDFPLFFRIRDAFAKGGSLREVAMMLARDHLYRDPSTLVTFLGLHDVPRFMNEPGATRRRPEVGLHLPRHRRAARRSSTTATRSRCRAGATRTTAATSRAAARATRGTPSRRRDARPTRRRCTRTCARSCTLRQATPALRRGRTVNLHVADKAWVYARVLEGARPSSASTPATRRRPSTCRPAPLGLADGARLARPRGAAGRGRRRGRPPAARPRPRLVGGVPALGRAIPSISLLSFMSFVMIRCRPWPRPG